mmetsp:Transcript_9255/g.27877  ORF Transcript_9255/g.27877 Transcript_9255/m.27877 type:complete len:304 (+) Transcript_9255:283-1194(+)
MTHKNIVIRQMDLGMFVVRIQYGAGRYYHYLTQGPCHSLTQLIGSIHGSIVPRNLSLYLQRGSRRTIVCTGHGIEQSVPQSSFRDRRRRRCRLIVGYFAGTAARHHGLSRHTRIVLCGVLLNVGEYTGNGRILESLRQVSIAYDIPDTTQISETTTILAPLGHGVMSRKFDAGLPLEGSPGDRIGVLGILVVNRSTEIARMILGHGPVRQVPYRVQVLMDVSITCGDDLVALGPVGSGLGGGDGYGVPLPRHVVRIAVPRRRKEHVDNLGRAALSSILEQLPQCGARRALDPAALTRRRILLQ